jgi:Rod binding domain-containing protein
LKLREKFTALLDELLKELKETTYVQGNFLSNGNGTAYTSSSGIYDQMMASTISNNYGSERETFKTFA